MQAGCDEGAVTERVVAILESVSEAGLIGDVDADLAALGVGSLAKVEAITAIEDSFDVEFTASEISGRNFATVRSIVELLNARAG